MNRNKPVPFWEKPLEALSQVEWEQLCDGCGKCCLHKLLDDETEEVFFTNVSCRLFDSENLKCSNYHKRLETIPDCVEIRLDKPKTFAWLPTSCSYRLRYENKPLPNWHPLKTGKQISTRHSVRNKVEAEASLPHLAHLEDYLITWVKC